MEASDDADPTADAAVEPPSRRTRRALARSVQLLGSRHGASPQVLFELRSRPARGGRQAQSLYPRPPASVGLDRRGPAQEAAIHLVRRVPRRLAALPRSARCAPDSAPW